jgi:hypothetical protein
MAARAGGFDRPDAVRLGAYAHLVDAGYGSYAASDNFDIWDPSTLIKAKKVPRTGWKLMNKTHYKKESGRDPKRVFPWVAFHFLPSGCTGEPDQYTLDHDGHKEALNRADHKWYQKKRKLGHKSLNRKAVKRRLKNFESAKKTKWGLKNSLICRPESQTSIKMIDDLGKLFEICSKCKDPHVDMEKAIKTRLLNSGDFIKTIDKFRKNPIIKNDGGMDWRKFLLGLAGTRMHILADTYAHQGFAGCRTAAVNDIDPDSFYYTEEGKRFAGDDRLTNENSTNKANPIFRPDHQTIKVKGVIRVDMTDLSYFGHGRAGSFPDYPNTHYKYKRPWDGKIIRRNNPKEFSAAFGRIFQYCSAISRAMAEGSLLHSIGI